MLRNHFYKILSSDKQGVNSIQTQLSINPEHPVFKGHFPEVPVVPGVCMMQMIKEQLEDRLGRRLQLSHASNIKFLSVINPVENPDLVLDILFHENENGTVDADGSISSQEKTFFKMAKAIYR